MSKWLKIIPLVLCLFFISAIKPHYGGTVRLRLQEPSSFSILTYNYSQIIFYTLLYENFFYLSPGGETNSHIFSNFRLYPEEKRFHLTLAPNISFSDGSRIQAEDIEFSLKKFLDRNIISSRQLSKLVRDIRIDNNEIILDLISTATNIPVLLSAPELVLFSENPQRFSGVFSPVEWEKGERIRLQANPYYPGGRTYLDGIDISFNGDSVDDEDMFVSDPGRLDSASHREIPAGVYQNIYLSFPSGNIGKNTRHALYSLLREYLAKEDKLTPLNALTSDDESPISIDIKPTSSRRIKSILRYSKVNLYVASSLKGMETSFAEYLEEQGIPIKTIFVGEDQLADLMDSTSIKFLLLEKVFHQQYPLVEKIKKIIKELTFKRFSEEYLRQINELDEMQLLNNEELLLDHLVKNIEKMINDGVILPLFQKRFSIYIKNRISGMATDYYGRPLFQKVMIKK